jgi:glutaredoxin 3
MADVVLYTKTGCPYCAAKRKDLTERKVVFTEINVFERPEAVPALLELTNGERVVPVVVDGGRVSVAPEGG